MPHLARTLARTLALALALPLAALACGSSDKSTAPPPTIETTTFAPSLGVDLASSTRLPSGLYYRDLTVGTGAVATSGMTVQVRYSAWLADGSPIDSNVSAQTPYAFTLGVSNVIAGWHEGIAGMRIGGRRQLIIPPALAYGAAGRGAVPPNAILVFNIELVPG